MKQDLGNFKSSDSFGKNFTEDEAEVYKVQSHFPGEGVKKMDPEVEWMIQHASRPHISHFVRTNDEIKDLD